VYEVHHILTCKKQLHDRRTSALSLIQSSLLSCTAEFDLDSDDMTELQITSVSNAYRMCKTYMP